MFYLYLTQRRREAEVAEVFLSGALPQTPTDSALSASPRLCVRQKKEG